MSNYSVIQVSPETLKKMQKFYQKELKPTSPPHSLFAAKKKGLTITAYQSGKVMFQGAEAATESQLWSKQSITTQMPAPKSQVLPQGFESWSVLGSDEVGNGSYFGPVTVCATYVAAEQNKRLKELGVKDSKMLKDPQIMQLAKKIKQTIPFRLLTVSPLKYNEIQPNYNVNHMKAVLHNQAIYLLLQDIAPEKPAGILIDQFTPEANYRTYTKDESNQVTEKLYFVTKGEQYHLAVAAASIIARAAFLEELDHASQEIGFKIPSGAGKNVDEVAARILQQGDLALLGRYAKLHFANTEKAKKLTRL